MLFTNKLVLFLAMILGSQQQKQQFASTSVHPHDEKNLIEYISSSECYVEGTGSVL